MMLTTLCMSISAVCSCVKSRRFRDFDFHVRPRGVPQTLAAQATPGEAMKSKVSCGGR